MEEAIEKLLNELCVEWGFCIDQESVNKLKNSESLEAEEFAHAVLAAEGMNAELEIEWNRKIKRKFTERFGEVLNSNAS